MSRSPHPRSSSGGAVRTGDGAQRRQRGAVRGGVPEQRDGVGRRVGEGIGAREPGIRGVGERAVGVEGQRAVRRVGVPRDGGRAIVVPEHVAGHRLRPRIQRVVPDTEVVRRAREPAVGLSRHQDRAAENDCSNDRDADSGASMYKRCQAENLLLDEKRTSISLLESSRPQKKRWHPQPRHEASAGR